VYHDPHVPQIALPDGDTLYSETYSGALLQDADCVVIVTNHQDFDWSHVLAHSPRIVDTRNVYPDERDNPRISRL
jgi:UDP-N-acetyl-D-glucosamine dehydrogenase